MRTNRDVVNLAIATAKQKLEPFRGTGTRRGNFEIYKFVVTDVESTLNAQNYSLSEDELGDIVLDVMVETERFQIGDKPPNVHAFRILQIVLAIVLVVLWVIALTLNNAPSNVRFQVYLVVVIATIGLSYVIFSLNMLIRSVRRVNILGG